MIKYYIAYLDKKTLKNSLEILNFKHIMEKKQKNSANVKAPCTSSSEMPNNCVISTTITSMPQSATHTPTTLTKGDAVLNHLQSSIRSTRQRSNNASFQQNASYNINTISEAKMTTPNFQLTQPQSQSLPAQKNCSNNQTSLMTAKAAACLTTPMEQLAAVHAKAISTRNKNEEAINDLKTRIPEIENIFDIHSRIGNGTFSTVLLGTLKKQRDLPDNVKRKFAIKHHIPTSHPDRIMKELQCMAKIGGTDNVVGINCCIRCNESVAFIMPFLAHDRFHDFFNKMDVAEVQFYMKNLLIALRHVHRFNVIHRDVKPSNFLYNRRKKQFLLVDFGLAQQVAGPQQNNKTYTAKLERSEIPESSEKVAANGSEGKRSREHVDGNKKVLIEAAVAITGTGEVVSGKPKRLRCAAPTTAPEQQTTANVPTGTLTRTANAANTVTLAHTPFKMPLKQINEIPNHPSVGSKGAAAISDIIESISEHKSAGGTAHSMTGRLRQRLRIQGGAEAVQNCSTRTSSVACSKNIPNASHAVNTNTSNNNSNMNVNADGKYNTNRNLMASNNNSKCFCYGNPQVCNICLVKKEIHASRAGTPGYRPPEVLLKYPDQTTAVDVWAAGVIFLSILSSVYPFFKAPNDYVALAEMITIFGDKTIRKTAYALDRLVTLSQKTKPLDLRKLCVRFRNRNKFSSPELLKKHQRVDGTCEVCKNCDQFFFNCLCLESSFALEPLDDDDGFPSSAYDLLHRLLEINPHKRITAEEALNHPFFEYSNKDKVTTSALTFSPVEASATAPISSALPPNTPLISLDAAGDSVKISRH